MRSRSFFTVVLLLGALLHAYIGVRILPDLPVALWVKGVGVAALVLSFLLIPLGMLSRVIHRQPLSDILAWVGLLTMGLFSSLLVMTVLRDVALLVMALLHATGVVGMLGWQQFSTGSAIAVPGLSLLMTVVGFVNARRVARVVEVDVPIADLPAALEGFTIAQISDIHVGPTIKREYLDRIVDRVNALAPDVIAVTGDLVDGSVKALSSHTAPFSRLSARYGAFVVTGNHEYYSNAHAWVSELTRLGLKVLMNEHVVISHEGADIVVAGVTDYSAHHFDEAHRSDPQAAVAGAPQRAPKILLAHQPRTADAAAKAGFDLQLSGHTHGGQFFPWNFFVPLQQPFVAGLDRWQGLWVYTSRGTGYWGPPKRFGAPSEITRIRLVKAP